VRVSVQDDGPGIEPELLPLVFDKYHHGKDGVGLGLSICKEYVELHGGEIWAEPGPTQGASFVFTVPLLQEAKRERPAAVSRTESQVPLVLVVEDEPELADGVCEMLRSRYRVELARDGAEGLAKVKSLLPDLVVMDVFLPRVDGLDTAAAIKSSPDTAEIPVILLSAHEGVADKVRALGLGAVDYMGKPFQGLELLSRVDKVLKLRQTEAELTRSLSMLRRSGNDPETGLFDRGGFVARLEQEMARSQRYDRPLSLALLIPRERPRDMRAVASHLRQKLRAADVLAHLGDGVIAILGPETPSAAMRRLSTRLLAELKDLSQVVFEQKVEDLQRESGGAGALLERLLPTKA
jgi:PleD family two-component response regulator